MYDRGKPAPWWQEAFVLSRAVFGVLFWPLAAIFGLFIAIGGLVVAFSAGAGWGVPVLPPPPQPRLPLGAVLYAGLASDDGDDHAVCLRRTESAVLYTPAAPVRRVPYPSRQLPARRRMSGVPSPSQTAQCARSMWNSNSTSSRRG